MKHTANLFPVFALTALTCLGVSSCSSEVDAAKAGDASTEAKTTTEVAVEAPVVSEPQVTSVDARALARWKLIENEDWIQAYNYTSKAFQKIKPLGQYLSGAENNHYLIKSDPQLLKTEGKQSYVQLVVEWTPTHPEVLGASNAGEGTLTEDIHMVETWVLEEGDWFYQGGKGEREFFKEHPRLFERSKPDETAKSETN